MLPKIRAILGFSPRIFFAIFLVFSFALIHFNFSRHAKSRKTSAQNALSQIQINSPYAIPNNPDKLYLQAVQLLTESLANLAQKNLGTEMLADQPKPQTLATCKSIFDETPKIRELLRDARLKDVQKLGDFRYAQIESLIGICVYSAYHCIETGNTKQAAEILLDAWHLDRLTMHHVVWIFPLRPLSSADSPLRLCIRRLGMRLKPNDPATPGVHNLIAQLLNESYVKSTYVYYALFKLLNFDRQKDSFFLVDPFLSRQYAEQVEIFLDNLRKIELGQFDIAFLENFRPARRPLLLPPPLSTLEASSSLLSPIDKVNIFLQNDVPDIRLTALSLACQLYRIHHNAWPTDINSLAPQFIPKIPALPIEPYIPRYTIRPFILFGERLPSPRIYRVKYSGGFERTLLTAGPDQDVLSPVREETMDNSNSIIPFGLRFADLAPFNPGQGAIHEVTPIAPTTQP
jgi:hypothetical protein